MNKFEILRQIGRYIKENSRSYTFGHKVNNIYYQYHNHSTGEGINIYLLDGDELTPVYYDYHWYHPHYEFNEKGKKHRYLIDNAPWNQIIENQFKEWEGIIIAKKAEEIELTAKLEAERMKKENEKMEKLKEKYSFLLEKTA